MENKKNSKGSNQSSSKNKATKPKGNPTSKKTVGKKTDNKNNQAKKNSKNTKQKVNKNTKQKVNRANENTIDLEKYSKYIEEHNPSESKSSRAKNNSEMKDVFSDSSMRAGKKPSKFKQSGFYKKWNSLEKWKRTTIIVVAVIFLILGIAYSAIFGILSGFKGEKLNKKDLGISDSSAYKNSDYINIAVFGLDTRSSESFSGRSDSIIIASVNKKNGKIKLTSILRDSYVAIDGYPNQKITHAYSLGGAKLAVKTLNQNYNMNIEDYVSFNFAKLAGLIDLTGGIDIEITQAERNEMNRVGREDGAKYKMVQSSGKVHLNGMQAVTYSRIRGSDSDIARAERQRKVIVCLVDNVKSMGLTQYDNFIKEAMKFCETSLSVTEILSFTPMLSKPITIETLVIPGEKTKAIGGMYNGAWVWRYDLGLASNEIHRFIYGEIATTVASTKATETSRITQKPTTTRDSTSVTHNTSEWSTTTTAPAKNSTTTTTTTSISSTSATTTTTKADDGESTKPVKPTSEPEEQED